MSFYPGMGLSSQISAEETIDSTRQGDERASAPEQSTSARLVGVHPPQFHMIIDLDDQPVTLGRAPQDATVAPIFHRTVSRSHLRIEWDTRSGLHVIRDLGSRNGSAVDGRPAESGWLRLRPGSVLRMGDLLLVYESTQTLEVNDPPEVLHEAVPGQAQVVRKLRAQIARAAPDVSPVLILGETGTGKERLAAELHRLSHRKGAFVAVNCAALGEQLIESQLFGHVKGAFTGASSEQPGLFRAAEGGTLFLDEVGEMPLELQPRLLRAIQEGEIRALGSAHSTQVDVRVVAATHRNLVEAARSGSFRQDLYARLALWQLEVPAIRHRRSDILFWVEYLYKIWMKSRGREPQTIEWTTDGAQRVLLAPWHENLRGLDRLVHELASSGEDMGKLSADHLASWIDEERS